MALRVKDGLRLALSSRKTLCLLGLAFVAINFALLEASKRNLVRTTNVLTVALAAIVIAIFAFAIFSKMNVWIRALIGMGSAFVCP